MTQINISSVPIKAGLVGTGFAAKLRAEALQADERSRLVAVSGYTPQKTQEFARNHQAIAVESWQELVEHPELDLVIIGTINRDPGAIARAALEAQKHVVVEYPLSLDPKDAESLIALAQAKGNLLHVEHIELLGGLHQVLRQSLPKIGNAFYARYVTITPVRPAPKRWTYQPELFGFPLSGAVSRIHRLTDLFGEVASVSCQSRFWDASEYYTACLCTAQLRFANDLIAEVTYGKDETFWQPLRNFEVHGEQGTPLYVSPEASCYALKVADAARQSAEIGKTISWDATQLGEGN